MYSQISMSHLQLQKKVIMEIQSFIYIENEKKS